MTRRQSPETYLDTISRRENPEGIRRTADGQWLPVEAVELDHGARGKGAERQMTMAILYRDVTAWPPAYMVEHEGVKVVFTGDTALEDADAYTRRLYGIQIRTAAALADRKTAESQYRSGTPWPVKQ